MKDKKEKQTQVEIEHPTIREVEHTTVHPGMDDDVSLYNVNFAPDENKYLK